MDTRQYALDLLKSPTERDLQTTIGPSAMGDPCDRCVAEALTYGTTAEEADLEPAERTYWLAAVLGTALHNLLEKRSHLGVVAESKVFIGHLEGYGDIYGHSDVFWPQEGIVGDYKSTYRSRLKLIQKAYADPPSEFDTALMQQARNMVRKHAGQIQLYGLGWENAGYDVNEVSIIYINRDGKTDNDVWNKDFKYDREYALKVWDRVERIWQALQGGRKVDTFLSKISCFSCTRSDEPRKWSKKPY